MQNQIYTIGHGKQPIEKFLELLSSNKIEILADVRAVARSRWPQFNQKALVVFLGSAKILYIHFPELGWKVQAPKEDFERGIEEIAKLSSNQKVCLMCAESLPEKCHRKLILTPPLIERNIEVIDIYPSGELKTSNKNNRKWPKIYKGYGLLKLDIFSRRKIIWRMLSTAYLSSVRKTISIGFLASKSPEIICIKIGVSLIKCSNCS